jgi:hypothetical protein
MNMKVRSLLLGTLLGGLTALVWSNISWELIGWHEKTLSTFQNDDEVAAVISSHTFSDGTYFMPNGTSKESQDRIRKGPIVLAAVRRSGIGSVGRLFATQIVALFAIAFLLTWLLLHTTGLTYARRVMFLAAVGLTAGAIVDLPNWNWWGFSNSFTAVNVADNILTCLFTGLVIAKVAVPHTQTGNVGQIGNLRPNGIRPCAQSAPDGISAAV